MIEQLTVKGVFEDDISPNMTGAIDTIDTLNSALKDMGGVSKTVGDEIKASVTKAIDTFVEFGAEAADVKQAMEELATSSSTGSKGLAQTANVMRRLMDESEDAQKSIKNVALAFELQAATGEKAEDSAAELGKLLRGDVSVLRRFDAQARRVADALEKIQDPAKRAALAQKELTRALKRQNSALGRARDGLADLDVELSKVGLSTKSIAGGILALGAAMAGATLVSIKNFADANKEVGEQLDASGKALKRASEAIGESQLNILGGAENISNFGLVAEGLTDDLIEMREEYIGFLKVSPSLVRGVAEVASEYLGLDSALKLVNAATRTNRLDTVDQIKLHHEEARALRALRIEELERAKQTKEAEELRKRQLQSGQMQVDPLTGATTVLEGPAPFSGSFFPTSTTTKPKGRRRRSGPSARALLTTIGTELEEEEAARKERERSMMEVMEQGAQTAKFKEELQGLSELARVVAINLGTALDSIQPKFERLTEEVKEFKGEVEGTGRVVDQFSNDSIGLMVGSLDDLVLSIAGVGASIGDLGIGLMEAMGDLSARAGQAMVLLSLGVGKIEKGDFSGALPIGLALIALGASLKGFAAASKSSNAGGGDGGQTARALERFGRRLFDRDTGAESREIILNVEGRQMRGYVLDTVNQGARARAIPALRRS